MATVYYIHISIFILEIVFFFLQWQKNALSFAKRMQVKMHQPYLWFVFINSSTSLVGRNNKFKRNSMFLLVSLRFTSNFIIEILTAFVYDRFFSILLAIRSFSFRIFIQNHSLSVYIEFVWGNSFGCYRFRNW